MRILVLGAGAVGGYFGGRLAEAGAEITFLVRAKRRDFLNRNGLLVKSPVGDMALKVKTLLAGDIAQPFDLVLLSCKAYDLDTAMDAVAPAMGSQSALLPLLNGIAHLDRLKTRFGAGAVLGGCCYAGITLDAEGVIQHINDLQTLYFGEFAGGRSARIDALDALLKRSKVDGQPSDDILQRMWEKLFMLAALAAATTLMRAHIGEIMNAPSGEAFVLATLDECRRIAAAEGHAPEREAVVRAHRLLTQRGSSFAASMFHDMRKGGPTESDPIIGDLVRRAAARGIDAPILRVALANLETHEAARAVGAKAR